MKDSGTASGYDLDAMRRLNRAEVRRETTESSVPEQDFEIRTTGEDGEETRIERADGLLWLGENATLRAGGRTIVSPMTYCSTGRVNLREPSCIYAHLPVDDLPDDGGLGYWPSYSEMKPSQRGRYLRWLSEGKRTHLDEIGYAFVYFYGLERRALIEDRDLSWIMEEVRRLLSRYPASRSFLKYLGGFLTLLCAKRLADPDMTEERLLDLHGFAPIPRKKTFPLLLAWYALRGVALAPEQAFYVLRHLPLPRSTPDAFPLRLRDLFCRRYAQVYPSGLTLSTSSRKCAVEYSVASGTLSFGERGKSPPSADIPNVLGKMSQFRKLREIWTTCLENEDGDLVLVRRAGERTPGEPLPRRRRRGKETPPKVEPIEIVIDMDRVERLRAETENVARKLAAVFGQDEPVPATEAGPVAKKQIPVPSDLPFAEEPLRVLDPKYLPVLREVLVRNAWSVDEWAALSRRHGFMPNALLEALNTWGEEALGDFLLLEEGGGLIPNEDVVKLQ